MLPLVYRLLVFAVMLTGIRLKVGPGISILGGSLLLALLFGLSPLDWIRTFPGALMSEEALIPGLIIITILAFSARYAASDQSVRVMYPASPWPLSGQPSPCCSVRPEQQDGRN